MTLSVANAAANVTESAATINPQAGSVIVYAHMDWNATNPQGKTPTTGSGTATERRDAGDGASYGQYLCDWEGTTAGSASYGTNNYTSLQVAKAVAEIRSDAGTVTISQYAQVSNWFSAAASSVTSVSWSAGDIIVCITGCANNQGTAPPTPSNANLSFSSAASSVSGAENECGINLYTATAASSQSGQTISLTDPGVEPAGAGVWVLHEVPSYTLDQDGFLWREDDGSETTATDREDEDTHASADFGENVRLRVQLDATEDPTSIAYTLRYKLSTDTLYLPVAVGATTALPTWVANGAQSIAAGAITPALPAGIVVGDILVTFVETANQATSISNGNGLTWTEIGSQVGTGTAGSTSATRLSMWWARYDGVATTGPTTNDSGDHQLGFVAAFNGCKQTGSPIHQVATFAAEAGPTTVNIPTMSATTVDNCLIVAAVADDWDNASTTRYGSWTNANLSNITERFDGGSATQNGGGLGMAVGEKASAGTVGAWTASANASIAVNVCGAFALAPNDRRVYVAASANITAGGEATTAQLTAPSGKSTSDFDTGRMWDNENGTDTIDITDDDYTEVEWCLQVQSPAAYDDVYQFRVYAGTTALDTYSVTPELTISTGTQDGTATPGAIAVATTIGQVTPQAGSAPTPAAIAVATTIGQANAHAPATATPAATAVPITIGAVTATGAGNAAPAAISVTTAIGQVVAGESVTATPGVINVPVTIGQATPLASSTVTPAAIAVPVTIGQATPLAGSVPTPAAINVVTSIGQATASGAGNTAPDAIEVDVTMGAVATQAGSTATPAAINVPVTIGQVSASGAGNVTPAAINVIVTLPAASASGASEGTANPGPIDVTTTLPPVTVAAGSVVTPAAIDVPITLGAATASGGTGAVASPGAISVTTTIGQATPLAGSTASPAVITVPITLPPNAPSAGATVTPDAITATVAIGQVATAGGATATPGSISVTVTMPPVVTNQDGTAFPDAIAVAISVLAVSIIFGEPIVSVEVGPVEHPSVIIGIESGSVTVGLTYGSVEIG